MLFTAPNQIQTYLVFLNEIGDGKSRKLERHIAQASGTTFSMTL